jgi:hypothetical protein
VHARVPNSLLLSVNSSHPLSSSTRQVAENDGTPSTTTVTTTVICLPA